MRPSGRHDTDRRLVRAAAAAAVIALLGGCSADRQREPRAPSVAATTPAPATTAPPPATPTPRVSATRPSPTVAKPSAPALVPPTARPARGRPDGEPERVVVTSARGAELVDATLVRTRLDDEGVLAPPPGVAGWYGEQGWPRPGFPGASILAGHINTRRYGPDTFARLPAVRPGAVVTVHYSSGDEVDFVVTRSKAVSKAQVPQDDSIWDAGNPRPLLRLITCDPTTPVRGGHYVGNWVVWASPVA